MSVRDGSALLRSIRADPADDFPRLLYADWCEENGQDERAEFIRVQIELEDESLDWRLRRERELSLFRSLGRLGLVGYGTLDPFSLGIDNALSFRWGAVHTYKPGETLAVLRRGFIHSVRCPLAAWIGERCAACMEPNEDVPHPACRLCRGAGRHSGHGQAIMAAHPVQRVELSNKGPTPESRTTGDAGRHLWWCGDGTDEHPGSIPHNLPPDLWALLPLPAWGGNSTWKVAPTREAALDALSDACVLYATPH